MSSLRIHYNRGNDSNGRRKIHAKPFNINKTLERGKIFIPCLLVNRSIHPLKFHSFEDSECIMIKYQTSMMYFSFAMSASIQQLFHSIVGRLCAHYYAKLSRILCRITMSRYPLVDRETRSLFLDEIAGCLHG